MVVSGASCVPHAELLATGIAILGNRAVRHVAACALIRPGKSAGGGDSQCLRHERSWRMRAAALSLRGGHIHRVLHGKLAPPQLL